MAKKKEVNEGFDLEPLDIDLPEKSIENELSAPIDKMKLHEDFSTLDMDDVPSAGFQNLEPVVSEEISIQNPDPKWGNIIYGIGNLLGIPVFNKSDIHKIAIAAAMDICESGQALESLVRVKVLAEFLSELEAKIKDSATDEAYSRGEDKIIRGVAFTITKGTTTYTYDHDSEYNLLASEIKKMNEVLKPLNDKLKERKLLLEKHANGKFEDEASGEEIIGAKSTADGTSESIRINIAASLKEEKPKRGKK